MADHPRSIYYPLRGNAYGLLVGAPLRRFEERLKVTSLLYDRVILESGGWMGQAGPTGMMESRFAEGGGVEIAVQSARERHVVRGGQFFVQMRPSDSAGPMHRIISSATGISLRASYAPIRERLPSGIDWIDFIGVDLLPEGKNLAKTMAEEELNDGLLEAALPDRYTRSLVIQNGTFSLLLAQGIGSSLSVDSLHRTVIAARAARGEARATLGQGALLAAIPEVRSMTWEQVMAARNLPGLPRLRAVLGEIEAAGRQAAAQGSDLDDALSREFHRTYERAILESQDGWGSYARDSAVGSALSLASVPLAGPGGLVAGMVLTSIVEMGRFLRGQRLRRNAWTSAASELTAMAERSAPDRLR